MKSNVIYFPYIRVPKSVWFTRLLLYWDKVLSISPIDFFNNPEAMGEHTRSLVEKRLVIPIPPGLYTAEIENFDSSFENYLNGLGDELDLRRKHFEEGKTFRIHMEKLGPIEWILVELKLSKESGFPWFEVELETGTEFMAYLAGCLGQHPELESDPVTDKKDNLEIFLRSERSAGNNIQELNKLRMQVLERIFPAPNHPLNADEIETFKIKHGDKLRSFRRAVEREILILADLGEPALRERRIELFQDEIQEQVDEIRAKLNESGFADVVLGKLCPILGALPGAHYVFGLSNAIFNAIGNEKEPPPVSPLAYAAYADVELLGNGQLV